MKINKFVVIGIIFILSGFYAFTLIPQEGLLVGLLTVIICFVIAYLLLRKGFRHNTKSYQPQPNSTYVRDSWEGFPEPPPGWKEYTFSVKGTTYDNETGNDIQFLLESLPKKSMSSSELYAGYTDSEIKSNRLHVSIYKDKRFPAKLIETTFEGEPAIKVYFDDNGTLIHVGWIAREKIHVVLSILSQNPNADIAIEITGGKMKYPTTTSQGFEEKEIVAIDELSFGALIHISYKIGKERQSS